MAKIISFSKRKKELKINSPQTFNPIYGILVWLYCPKCKLLQYTAVTAHNGRKHKCGETVIEIEVPVDFRAELTICLENLKILKELEDKKTLIKKKDDIAFLSEVIKSCQKEEQLMIEKIFEVLGDEEIDTYSFPESKKLLPIKQINKIGLMISDFRFEPNVRFRLFGINIPRSKK